MIGLMETAKDITERQRVEEALSLNELQVHALLQLHEMADQPMQMIIDFALEKAIELTRSKVCYLAFVNADETVLTMHLWPKAQRAAELAPQINPLAEAGRWAEAVRQRQPVIANQDALPNCFETGAPDGVELMRHMDVPVFEGERIVAVAGVGNKETPYDENDVRQLMLLLLGMWRLVQRKQGEDRLRATADALRRSEAYLVEAQRLTHTGSWADDGTGRPLYWSEELYRIFGFDPQQGLPTRDQSLERIHQEDLDKFLHTFETAIRQKVDAELEYRIMLPDGSVKYVHTIGHPVLNADGELAELVGTTVDITARKRAEETLRRSQAYLAEAERLTHTGSFAGDSTTQPLYWSEELYRTFGFDPQQGLPTRDQPLERIHPEDRDSFLQAFSRVIDQRVDSEVEFRIVLPDGAVKWVHGIGHPVLNANGELVEVIGTTVDITERKHAEEERVRLHQLETDLEHINRVSIMGELTASIAHEVNQPLSGVVSNGSACLRWLAGDTPNIEEARETARRIVRDGRRAAEIIGRIRALTKRTAMPRGKLDLNETIREILPLVGDEAKKKSVMIRTCFGNDVFPVLGDRVQLQQVVLNLVMNGIEAMNTIADRARELLITSRNTDPDQVEVTVEDSGTGLDPDASARIFDAFYTTKPAGMGMGLSICRSILQAHHGRLWATANQGPGTTFHFTLPKEQLEADAEPPRV
jgi:PAS domain S-box-containing protein